MKTQKNNTITKLLKTCTALSLAFILAIAPVMANNGSHNNKKKVSTEDSLMIEELQVAFDIEKEISQLNNVTEAPTFQVFDNNDQLIFSGSKKEWNDHTNKGLTMIKRKAEFLFDTDGTQVYKMF